MLWVYLDQIGQKIPKSLPKIVLKYIINIFYYFYCGFSHFFQFISIIYLTMVSFVQKVYRPKRFSSKVFRAKSFSAKVFRPKLLGQRFSAKLGRNTPKNMDKNINLMRFQITIKHKKITIIIRNFK